jgi:hypothetical protein
MTELDSIPKLRRRFGSAYKLFSPIIYTEGWLEEYE